MAKVKRQDLRDLANLRIEEARSLINASHFPGAYYLTGLAVECAIKACIAKETEQYEFPDKNRVTDSWKHNLAELINTAGLQQELLKTGRADQQFEANWRTVKDWNVESRYEKKTSKRRKASHSSY